VSQSARLGTRSGLSNNPVMSPPSCLVGFVMTLLDGSPVRFHSSEFWFLISESCYVRLPHLCSSAFIRGYAIWACVPARRLTPEPDALS
jgi:hypothetical protein